MKRLSLILVFIIFAEISFAQVTTQNRQFLSQSLGRNRHVVVFKPDACTETSPCPVLIFLPGWLMPQTSFPFFNDVMSDLINSGQIEPMLIVVPDGRGGIYSFTDYWNSDVNGNYGDYISKDLVNWITEEYPIRKGVGEQHYREYWLISGFSMGANGCSRLALKHHNVFSGFASFSGELSSERYRNWFDYVNRYENPDFTYSPPDGKQLYTSALWATASILSPDSTAPYMAQFPLEQGTGVVRDSVFNIWLQANPVKLANEYFNVLGNPFHSMNVFVRVATNEHHISYFEFSKDFSDSLNSWDIYHEFDTHDFGHDFNEELATELLLWANAHFAPQIVHQYDIELKPPMERIFSINAYTKFNPQVLIRNIGSETQLDVPVSCEIKKGELLVYSNIKTIDTLATLETKEIIFEDWYPMETQNYVMSFYTSLTNDENHTNDTLSTALSVSEIVDDFEFGFGKWFSFTGWDVTDRASHSGNYNLTSIPNYQHNYENNVNSWVDYRFSLNLSSIDLAYLSFWTKFETEPDADFGYIEISPDNGTTWDRIENTYSGIQQRWSEEIVSLKEYCGPGFDNVKLRFRFVTDANQGKPLAGWFLDDVAVRQVTHHHDLDVSASPDFHEKLPILANLIPKIIVRNLGKEVESNVLSFCQIDTNKTVVYSDIQALNALESLHSQLVTFNPSRLDQPGNYLAKFHVNLSVDENHINDTLFSAIKVTNLLDDFESELGLSNWGLDTKWGLTGSRSKYGNFSLSSSPQGSYENNIDNSIEYNYSFNFSDLQAAHISYWTSHFIEINHDFGYIEISVDSGQTWSQVGDAYTGFQASWKHDGRSLTQFCGPGFHDVRIRFRFVTDSTQAFPTVGWFLDDVAIYPTELLTSLTSNEENAPPEDFSLSDNYPNPFNPSTTIQFAIPKSSKVKLKIFDMLGREVATLVNEELQAGEHKVIFDSKELPSGVYFYRLQAEEFTATKKLLLLK